MTTSGNLAVFCDFDGTISRRDVGYHMFHHFSDGRNDELVDDWKDGTMSNRDILLAEAEMVRATPGEFYAHVDTYDIDTTFVEFSSACHSRGIPVTIVSEGLDLYIKRILKRFDLDHIPVICNQGFLENGGMRIAFPHTNRHCVTCGSCKGERIAEIRQELGGDITAVFVGDGYSDACAAAEADVLFAKKDLERYCLSRNITYNAYRTFQDVTRLLIEQGHLND